MDYSNSAWPDKATFYNGNDITYDASGNPTSLDGATLQWENGRWLKSYSKGAVTSTYTYDSNGIRVSKYSSNSEKYTGENRDYTTVDGRITSEYVSGGGMGIASYDYRVYYRYDENNSPIGFDLTKDGTTSTYTYEKNVQGDIVGIISDSTRRRVVTYVYDAWGKLLSTSGSAASTVGKYNSLRYRGYYYDSETGYYYLQSRYYDPSYKRFINADEPELISYLTQASTLGGNLFAYCENNAVMGYDPSGYVWFYNLTTYYNYYHKKYSGRLWRNFLSNYNRYKKGYDTNKKLFGSYNDYIWGQAYKWDKINVNIRDMVYDKAKIKDVGCELVAVYNVMKRLGKWQNFANLITEFVINGLSWNYGYFGTESKYLAKYFDSHSVKYSHYYKDVSRFEKKAKKGRIAIMSFWNSGWFCDGIHTVAVFYKNGKWIVYNYSKYDETTSSFNNLTEIFKKTKYFIRGYVF